MNLKAASALVLLACTAATARATPNEDSTRIAVGAGWRYQPNARFGEWASGYGTPLLGPSPGGPGVLATFGYQALPNLEVSMDVGLFEERFAFADRTMGLTNVPITVNVRYFPWQAQLSPYVGLGAGYFLNFVSDSPKGGMESHGSGPLAILGAVLELSQRWSMVVEYRLGLARVELPGVGYLQTGGNTLVLGAQMSFPPEVRRLP